MEKYFVVFLLQAVILALSFQSGMSVKCYVCNSNLNAKCGDPADKTQMEARECTLTLFQEASDQAGKALSTLGKVMNMDIPGGQIGQNAKFACQKIKIHKNGVYSVMRGCTMATSESGDPCSAGLDKMTDGQGKVEYCGTCEEDYCNGSSRQSFTALFLMFVPCFAAFISRLVSI